MDKAIIFSHEQFLGNLYVCERTDLVDFNSDERERRLIEVCYVLHCYIWLKTARDIYQKQIYAIEIQILLKVSHRWEEIKLFRNFKEGDVHHTFYIINTLYL